MATQPTGRQEPQPNSRKRRSAKRLLEFQQKKRYKQLAGCKLQRTLLRAMKLLRWLRAQEVWTRWMRANTREPSAMPMLLDASMQSAPAPATKKRSVEGSSPGEAGPASGAAHASSPTTTGGKQPRVLAREEATSGDGGYKTWRVPELADELRRRGIDATGSKAQLVARLVAAPPLLLPPPT